MLLLYLRIRRVAAASPPLITHHFDAFIPAGRIEKDECSLLLNVTRDKTVSSKLYNRKLYTIQREALNYTTGISKLYNGKLYTIQQEATSSS